MDFDPASSNVAALDAILRAGKRCPDAQISEVFPHLIYTRTLDPDPAVFDSMLEYMQRFEEHSAKSIRSRAAQAGGPSAGQGGAMGSGPGESGGEPRRPSASTGDVHGHGKLSATPEFQWLNSEVEKSVVDYVERIGLDAELISFFHQKSWPVVARQGAGVSRHSHPNATISAVYYLCDIEPGQGGALIFSNPETSLLSGYVVDEKLHRSSRSNVFGIRPSKNMLVVFPSHLVHHVSAFKGDEHRYSASYDIFVTGARSVDPGSSENLIPDPSHWTRFEDSSSASS